MCILHIFKLVELFWNFKANCYQVLKKKIQLKNYEYCMFDRII